MTLDRKFRGPFLLCIALLTFLPFLGRRDIVTSHEARVVQVARQMAESGWPWNASPISVPQVSLQQTPQGERLLPKPDGSSLVINPWIVPVMNGQIRLQKPPLPYWCTAILYRLIGFNETTSRLVPAILGAISVILVWDLARRLLGKTMDWYAGLAWISSYFIIDEFRKSMADPYLAFFVLAAFYAWVRRCNVTFYVMIALGILSKGPIILLFAAVLIPLYEFYYKPKQKWNLISHLIGLTLLLLIALPWGIAILRTIPNAMELWRYESVGALSDKSEDARPWWFYLPNLLLITLPWTPIWAMALFRRRRRFAPAATALVVLILSFSYAKKIAYLLPMAPIQCLIVAQGLMRITAASRGRGLRLILNRVTVLAVIFSVAAQVYVSGIQAWSDNNRSPRGACQYLKKLLEESPQRSVLVSRMPEEAMVYLPLGLRDSTESREVYVVLVDSAKHDADARVHEIKTTSAGPVESVQEIPLPNPKITRWKLFRLSISPVQRAAPGAG